MDEENKEYSLQNLILYKMDRTLAVLGLIFVGVLALWTKELPPEAAKIATAVVTGLVAYLGFKGAK